MRKTDQGAEATLPDDSRSQSKRSILLRLTEDEFRRLRHVADALNLSVSETLRSLIPSIRFPDREVVTTEADIAVAAAFDVVPTTGAYDRDQLRRLLKDIRRENAAIILAQEIDQQICQSNSRTLTVETYKRLSRWCHPHRWTEREKRIRPLARQVSELLFEKVIERLA